MQLTYRFQLRDTCDAKLRRQARAVNQVWNFCEKTQQHALNWNKRWPTDYDLQKLTADSGKALDLHGHTIQQVCQRFEHSRKQHRKWSLRWRVSNFKSPKYSLGWVPLNKGHVTYCNGGFVFRGRHYRAWVSRDLKEGQTFRAGSFSQDAHGHWYINLPTEVEALSSRGATALGIDLGLKDLATLSTGEKIEHPRWYRVIQDRLVTVQRARKKRQVKKMYARMKAQRSAFQHQLSLHLVQEHGAIFHGNVNASGLAKTGMAKCVIDAGWSQLRNKLEYKAIRQPLVFREVNEAFSTQTCSDYGIVGGSKDLKGLAIRHWICRCGASHDRDVNAAKVIAARGLASLAVGACNG